MVYKYIKQLSHIQKWQNSEIKSITLALREDRLLVPKELQSQSINFMNNDQVL